MTETITAYVGRENITYLTLSQNDETVLPNAVTRAVFRFGPYCLDTAVNTHPIALIENKTKVRLKLGLVSSLIIGTYTGKLTIWDASMGLYGKKWGDEITVKIKTWETCS